MAALLGQHARQVRRLLREFAEEQNPTVDFDVDQATWTPEQDEAWRLYTAEERERFARERAELVTQLKAESTASSSEVR